MKQTPEHVKRMPISGTFELTGRCNLNCEMCYVHVDQQRIQKLGYRERTADEWISMAQQIFDAGTFRLLLTGGEPMLRPDFCQIYEAIGPPHTLGITIYGVSPDTYKKVCGNSDGYHMMMSGLKMLLTLPSHIELRTTIVKDNLDEADKIEKFIKSFGNRVTFNINQTVFQSGRDSIGDAAKCRLSPQQNAAFYCNRYCRMVDEYVQNPEKRTELRLNQEAHEPKEPAPQEAVMDHMPYGCHAGYQEYTITWDGRMLPCTLFGGCFTEPFAEGFEQAWTRLETVMPKLLLPEQCRQCSVQQFCGVCAASRYCETGDVNGIPEYFCQLAEAYTKLLK